jgi:hypothetical protein
MSLFDLDYAGRRLAILVAVMGLFSSVAGCGGSGGSSGSTGSSGSSSPPSLVSIQVTPATPSVASGLTAQFVATGVYSDQSTKALTTQVTWASSNTSLATISNAAGSNGLATTTSVGTATISATSGSISGNTNLTVSPATLVSIQVTPASRSVTNGMLAQFIATGLYTDQSTQNLTAQVTWSSSNTSAATISNAAGANALTTSTGVGSTTITATSGSISGNSTLTVTVASSATGGAVKPVYPTSYENKNNIVMDNPQVPDLPTMGITMEPGEMGINTRSIAFADFTQSGSYSAIVFSNIYKNAYPALEAGLGTVPDSPSKIYFLQKNASGNWTDITSTLIKDLTTRYTCVSPSFVEIADINNDGKPDAYLACTGTDFAGANSGASSLSSQFEILSQPDGSYTVTALPNLTIYGHQAALADIDRDGNVDILTVDSELDSNGNPLNPFILWGHGDGTFTRDLTRFPAEMTGKQIFGVRAIPVSGKINVIVSGFSDASYAVQPTNGYGSKVLHYSNGAFQNVLDLTPGIPNVTATGLQYGLGLDFVYDAATNAYYVIRVDPGYSWSALVKTDATTGASTILNETNLPDGSVLKVTSGKNIVFEVTNCDPGMPTSSFFYNMCTLSVPVN